MNKKAFTLVELIVVITILAILWTIGFISMQNYALSARDSSRVTDMWNMLKSLELYVLQNWKYPEPGNSVQVNFSWSLAWKQGEFDENILSKIGRISKVPKDPLTWSNYTYSRANNNTEIQIGGILEWSLTKLNSQVNAWDVVKKAYVKWNYNWKILKVTDWNVTYLLGVPSIISSDITLLDVQAIANASNFVYNWQNNLPASYTWTTVKLDGWFDYNPSDVVAWSWDIDDLSDQSERNTFITNLNNAYSWTVVENTVSWTDDNTAKTILNSGAGTNLPVSWGSSSNSWGWWNQNSWPVCTDMTQDNVDNLNNVLIANYDDWYTSIPLLTSSLTKNDWCNLTELAVNKYNAILPSEIWFLTSLTHLELNANHPSLPNEIWNLINLETLIIKETDFNSLPTWIWNLTKLKKVELYRNALVNIWPEIWNLVELEYLTIQYNDVIALPTEIWNLAKLKELTLINSDITNIPSQIGNLTELEVLNFWWNQLSSIPNEIWNLTKLKHLNIMSNQITSIPSTIWNIINLEYLWSSHNNITIIPNEIWNLINLEYLILSNNNITTLPNEIWNLQSITDLSLENNNLNNLPDWFKNLTTILRMNLSNNTGLNNISRNYYWSFNGNYCQDNIPVSWKEMCINANSRPIVITVQDISVVD